MLLPCCLRQLPRGKTVPTPLLHGGLDAVADSPAEPYVPLLALVCQMTCSNLRFPPSRIPGLLIHTQLLPNLQTDQQQKQILS